MLVRARFPDVTGKHWMPDSGHRPASKFVDRCRTIDTDQTNVPRDSQASPRSPFVSTTSSACIFRSHYGIASAMRLFEHARPLSTHDPACIWRITMRSKLVFGATTHVPNRFLLVKLASKTTRALHRPNSRIQETINDVLVRCSHANPIASVLDTDIVQLFDRAA